MIKTASFESVCVVAFSPLFPLLYLSHLKSYILFYCFDTIFNLNTSAVRPELEGRQDAQVLYSKGTIHDAINDWVERGAREGETSVTHVHLSFKFPI